MPWNVIADVSLFHKKEPYVDPVPTIGLNVTDPEAVQTTKHTRKKLLDSKVRHGWHLFFFAETLTVPLVLATRAIQFYLTHPEYRRELGTSSGLARIDAMLASEEALAPPVLA
jgi:hypothetical protein